MGTEPPLPPLPRPGPFKVFQPLSCQITASLPSSALLTSHSAQEDNLFCLFVPFPCHVSTVFLFHSTCTWKTFSLPCLSVPWFPPSASLGKVSMAFPHGRLSRSSSDQSVSPEKELTYWPSAAVGQVLRAAADAVMSGKGSLPQGSASGRGQIKSKQLKEDTTLYVRI